MTPDLFGDTPGAFAPEPLAPGAVVLRGYAAGVAGALLAAITEVAAGAPFRQMKTPGGYTMSVAMTGCGEVCWVTDQTGYRYQAGDPLSGQPWPAMPEPFLRLAGEAAAAAGYRDFIPDACLINRYCPGSRMSLHQDRDERDFDQPIVSVSLGLPATFQFGGETRRVRPVNVPLSHGDVVVWGGPARLRYHGVLRLKQGWHPLTGEYRYNLTFRRAL
ncbi:MULTISPECIES: DNA oxidative demethylase AlkB [Marinobacter]|uniref:DNA oxidative demethylase AlkB n=1 Tax=Marinobacter profundi TaxID=2666256 RepID=A0A2G1UGJ9_9GAMM|nr:MULTISPECIES: DNA oxidative demethylase AlkB [Marinobacter]MBD3655912.1 DNA oxidative demethylase AlkB [Marinobacter sp.]PHQ13597.1 DNA oxidative demethylase AlkB [Marinobacter profundi]